jgi:hypothetical protein
MMAEARNVCSILTRKGILGNLRRWDDNINVDIIDIGLENWRWMEVNQDCVRCSALGISGVGKFEFFYHSYL